MSLVVWAQGSDGWTWARAGAAAVRTATEAAASRNRRAERILGLFLKRRESARRGTAPDNRKDRDTAIADAPANSSATER
jgi:hypothetical protein